MNLLEAIELTIERHKKAIELDIFFGLAKDFSKPFEWKYHCPLCEYTNQECDKCPWVTIQQEENPPHWKPCTYSDLDFNDSKQSIDRLEAWKKGEKYEVEKA
jgi:hypothetical protein